MRKNLTIQGTLGSVLSIFRLAGLGLQLVNTLVAQLEGTIEMENQEGTQFGIEFEKQDP